MLAINPTGSGIFVWPDRAYFMQGRYRLQRGLRQARETNWEAVTGEILPWFGLITPSPFSISVLIFPMDSTFALRLK